jgi:2-polyprenyl-6-methoxyphenol hydroxylase-like FAD-dependent oxidoreductase
VVLSVPVLCILRSYGVDIENLGAFAVTELRDWKGHLRARLPFNKRVEEMAGLPGWNYGMLRSAAYERMLEVLPPEAIHAGHRCVGFEETEDAVRVRFEHGGA